MIDTKHTSRSQRTLKKSWTALHCFLFSKRREIEAMSQPTRHFGRGMWPWCLFLDGVKARDITTSGDVFQAQCCTASASSLTTTLFHYTPTLNLSVNQSINQASTPQSKYIFSSPVSNTSYHQPSTITIHLHHHHHFPHPPIHPSTISTLPTTPHKSIIPISIP